MYPSIDIWWSYQFYVIGVVRPSVREGYNALSSKTNCDNTVSLNVSNDIINNYLLTS
jgi:hypothetical protein